MNKYQQKHIVKLSNKERTKLKQIVSNGSQNVRIIKRAQILLATDRKYTDKDIARNVGVTSRTVERVRLRCTEEGLNRALYDNPRAGADPILDSEKETYLVAITCSDPPEGFDRWTLELLKERLIKDKKVKTISTVAIWKRLTNRGIKPWREKNVVHS